MAPTSSSKDASVSASSFAAAVGSLWQGYSTQTPRRLKLLDVYLVFLMLVGALQLVYCIVFGNFPFNSFLAGFSATVASFVFTASLRIQVNVTASEVSPERAYADWIFCHVLLFLAVVNFIG